jgi:hypothetical protein
MMKVFSYDLFTQELLCASYAWPSYQPTSQPLCAFIFDSVPLRYDNYQSFCASLWSMCGHGDAIMVLIVSYILCSCESTLINDLALCWWDDCYCRSLWAQWLHVRLTLILLLWWKISSSLSACLNERHLTLSVQKLLWFVFFLYVCRYLIFNYGNRASFSSY